MTYDVIGFINHHNRAPKGVRGKGHFDYDGVVNPPTTVVINGAPNLQSIIDCIPDFESRTFPVKLGYSICLPEDQFVRKVGVEMANKRMQDEDLKIVSIYTNGVFINVQFKINSPRFLALRYIGFDKGPKLLSFSKRY